MNSSGKALRIMQITFFSVMVAILRYGSDYHGDAESLEPPAAARLQSNMSFTKMRKDGESTMGCKCRWLLIIIASDTRCFRLRVRDARWRRLVRENASPKMKNLKNHREHHLLLRADLHGGWLTCFAV